MQPVMNALRAADGQASNADLNAAIVAALDLPPALIDQPHQPGANLTELEYRLQIDLQEPSGQPIYYLAD
jgi:hypothetical protein